MFRSLSVLAIVAISALMTGCYSAPMGCGTCCDNCDGVTGPYVPHRPFERLLDARKSALCGNGCGEIYYGEWRNYPPDCCDPCDNAQQCTPPIACRPHLIAGLLTGWYGKRHPRGYHDDCCDDCGFDDCGCDAGFESDCGCGGDMVEGAIVGSGGCASCTPKSYQQDVEQAFSPSRSPSRVPNRVQRRTYQPAEQSMGRTIRR